MKYITSSLTRCKSYGLLVYSPTLKQITLVIVISRSKALLKSQEHQGTSLFTSAATNQRGVFQRGSREAQVRFPEGQEGTEKVLRWMLFRWGGLMISKKL